ncbi:MAG TPA: metal-sensitive transcriptional regulator [Acidimicrobiia bacterium]|nr:metal-sensitive transcriptional regulator [Acidimicrobiia bacterium]
MKAETASVGFRLRSAQGHLDAVIRMAEDDRYCVDVLHQLSAVQGALDHVHRDILEAHLRCVPQAVAEARTDELVDEIIGATFGTAPRSHLPAEHCRAADGACGHRN